MHTLLVASPSGLVPSTQCKSSHRRLQIDLDISKWITMTQYESKHLHYILMIKSDKENSIVSRWPKMAPDDSKQRPTTQSDFRWLKIYPKEFKWTHMPLNGSDGADSVKTKLFTW